MKRIRYGRTINVGRFESVRIDLEDDYSELLSDDEVFSNLKTRVEKLIQKFIVVKTSGGE